MNSFSKLLLSVMIHLPYSLSKVNQSFTVVFKVATLFYELNPVRILALKST